MLGRGLTKRGNCPSPHSPFPSYVCVRGLRNEIQEFIKYRIYGSKRDRLPKQIQTRARSLCPSPHGRRSNYNLTKISEQDPYLTTEAKKRRENLEKPKGFMGISDKCRVEGQDQAASMKTQLECLETPPD